MEIHNHGNNLRAHSQSTKRGQQPATPSLSAEKGVEAGERVKPQRLLERLQGNQAVREHLLVEIKAKIHAGEYNTRAAVEQAAQQIVDP